MVYSARDGRALGKKEEDELRRGTQPGQAVQEAGHCEGPPGVTLTGDLKETAHSMLWSHPTQPVRKLRGLSFIPAAGLAWGSALQGMNLPQPAWPAPDGSEHTPAVRGHEQSVRGAKGYAGALIHPFIWSLIPSLFKRPWYLLCARYWPCYWGFRTKQNTVPAKKRFPGE